MKILTYSDVHLEFGHNWHPPTDIDGDVMLLAGDIVSFKHYNPLKFLLKFWNRGGPRK
jgi:predicted phosphodiesterase